MHTQPQTFIDHYFPVLDHGHLGLVDYMGGDDRIERFARVSYGKGTRSKRKTRGLIRYLMRHKHTSPLESVQITVHAAMPLFVIRQWHRHRTQSYNEYSGRYSVMPRATYTPNKWRLQSKKNRQGSANDAHESKEDLDQLQDYLHQQAWEEYEGRLNDDISRELARVDLPLSTYTEMYLSVNLHNLFHFLSLRLDSHAQWEIRQYAKVLAGIAYEVAPAATEAFLDYGLNSYTLSDAEIKALRDICAGGRVNESELSENGMSNREIREFKDIMFGDRNSLSVDDIRLDLKRALTPEQAHIRLHGESSEE